MSSKNLSGGSRANRSGSGANDPSDGHSSRSMNSILGPRVSEEYGDLDVEQSSKLMDEYGEEWVKDAGIPDCLFCRPNDAGKGESDEQTELLETGKSSITSGEAGETATSTTAQDPDAFHEKCDDILVKTDYSGLKYKLTMLGAISNLTAGIIGAGVLSMPLALQFSGVLVGFILIFIVAFLSHMGGYYLGMAGRMTGKRNISDIAHASLGNIGTVLVVYSMLGLTVMAAIAYVVLWYSLMVSSLKFFGVDSAVVDNGVGSISFISLRTGVMSGLVVLVSPLCCLNTTKALSFTSILSVVIFFVLIIVLIVEYCRSYKSLRIEEQIDINFEYKIEQGTITAADYNHPCFGFYNYEPEGIAGKDPLHTLFTMSLLSTSFLCHFGCVDVYCNALKKPTLVRQQIVMGVTITVAVAFYGMFAGLGWDFAKGFRVFSESGLGGTCKQGAQSVFSDNLVRGVVMGTEKEKAAQIVQAVISFLIIGVLFLSYPQFILGARMCILGMVWKKKDDDGRPLDIPTWIGIVTSLSLVLFTLIIAIVFPKILSVLAYAGCGPGAALVYILPPAMILSLNRKAPWSHRHKWFPLVMIIIGVFFSVSGFVIVGMYSYDLNNGANRDLDKKMKDIMILDAQGDAYSGKSVRYFFDWDQKDFDLEGSYVEVTAFERSLLYQMRNAAQGMKFEKEVTKSLIEAQLFRTIMVKAKEIRKINAAEQAFNDLKAKIPPESWEQLLTSFGQNVADAWNNAE